MRQIYAAIILTFWAQVASAISYDECILAKTSKADNEAAVQTIREACKALVQRSKRAGVETRVINQRFLPERQTQWNRHSMTARKQNYILPYTHSDKVNRKACQFSSDWHDELKHYESKFQLFVQNITKISVYQS